MALTKCPECGLSEAIYAQEIRTTTSYHPQNDDGTFDECPEDSTDGVPVGMLSFSCRSCGHEWPAPDVYMTTVEDFNDTIEVEE